MVSMTRKPNAIKGQSVHKVAALIVLIGIVFSAPFAFYPKHEVIGAIAFLLMSLGLALSSSLSRLRSNEILTHFIALIAAASLFVYHSFDLLYIKFLLSLLLSFQLTLVDWSMLKIVRDRLIYLGARGAILAFFSFVIYFAFNMDPFYRTMLGDGRLIPFFGVTNINFGFDNPEWIIFARPAFLFDEPGQFAHFVLLLLALIGVSSKFDARRWRFEVLLLAFSGIATLSLAFWIVSALYLCSQLRRLWVWPAASVLVLTGFLFSDNALVEAVYSRLGSTEQSSELRLIAGDNRSREIELAYDAFKENPIWGAGWTHAEQTVGHFAANPLGPLGYSGLMAIFLYLPLVARFLHCAKASANSHQLLIIFIVLLFFAQRPYFYFPIFILLTEILQRQIVISRRTLFFKV